MKLSIQGIDWAMSPAVAGFAAVAIGDVWNFGAGACPSYMTVVEFAAREPRTRRNIRLGYLIGGTQGLFVGMGLTLISRSWWPFAAACLGVAGMVGMYEHALNQDGGSVGIADQ